jgi:hypothetical protein
VIVVQSPENIVQDQASSILKLNEKMLRFVSQINNENNKAIKLQYIIDFYLFLKHSMDDIMLPKYHRLITAIVEKTQEHMNTLEDEYFPEMCTRQQQNHMFECYYTLSSVKRSYSKYLYSLRSTPPATAALASSDVITPTC